MHSQQAGINNCHKRYAQLGHLSLFYWMDIVKMRQEMILEREEMGIG